MSKKMFDEIAERRSLLLQLKFLGTVIEALEGYADDLDDVPRKDLIDRFQTIKDTKEIQKMLRELSKRFDKNAYEIKKRLGWVL